MKTNLILDGWKLESYHNRHEPSDSSLDNIMSKLSKKKRSQDLFLPPWPPKPDFNPNPTLYKNSSLKFLSIQLEGWFGFLRFDPQTQTRLDSKLQRTQTGNCTLSLVLKSNASQNDVKMPTNQEWISIFRQFYIFLRRLTVFDHANTICSAQILHIFSLQAF